MRLEMVTHGSHPLQSRVHNEDIATAADRSMINKVQVRENPDEINHSKQDVKNAVTKLNDIMEPLRTNLKFVFHEKLEKYYVTVVDQVTDEVLKEIPPKKMLDMYASMAEFMGILVDKKI
ncbi:flagellar protein FlaG [Lentibacillus sp. N15]|uniref:flagellar protein FlaG n=1 Tax=Lentibacillus songyuanensis TaxID=3136161 RepID=UPI0031B9B61C